MKTLSKRSLDRDALPAVLAPSARRRLTSSVSIFPEKGDAFENFHPSDHDFGRNFRGHMLRCCDLGVYVAWRHYGSDTGGRREGLRLVLGLSREYSNRSWLAVVVDSAHTTERLR